MTGLAVVLSADLAAGLATGLATGLSALAEWTGAPLVLL